MCKHPCQEIIKDKYNLNVQENLCSQSYDGAANMMGHRSGVATRIQRKYPMAVPNHCVCHGSSLPVKAAFRDIKILENFSTQAQDLLRMLKKSPQKDAYLQYAKDAAPSDNLQDKPSEVGGLIEWCVTRWTENKKALQAIKNNLL